MSMRLKNLSLFSMSILLLSFQTQANVCDNFFNSIKKAYYSFQSFELEPELKDLQNKIFRAINNQAGYVYNENVSVTRLLGGTKPVYQNLYFGNEEIDSVLLLIAELDSKQKSKLLESIKNNTKKPLPGPISSPELLVRLALHDHKLWKEVLSYIKKYGFRYDISSYSFAIVMNHLSEEMKQEFFATVKQSYRSEFKKHSPYIEKISKRTYYNGPERITKRSLQSLLRGIFRADIHFETAVNTKQKIVDAYREYWEKWLVAMGDPIEEQFSFDETLTVLKVFQEQAKKLDLEYPLYIEGSFVTGSFRANGLSDIDFVSADPEGFYDWGGNAFKGKLNRQLKEALLEKLGTRIAGQPNLSESFLSNQTSIKLKFVDDKNVGISLVDTLGNAPLVIEITKEAIHLLVVKPFGFNIIGTTIKPIIPSEDIIFKRYLLEID